MVLPEEFSKIMSRASEHLAHHSFDNHLKDELFPLSNNHDDCYAFETGYSACLIDICMASNIGNIQDIMLQLADFYHKERKADGN